MNPDHCHAATGFPSMLLDPVLASSRDCSDWSLYMILHCCTITRNSKVCFPSLQCFLLLIIMLIDMRQYWHLQDKHQHSVQDSTAWSTDLFSASCPQVTKGHNWHIDYMSVILFCHGEQHVEVCAPSIQIMLPFLNDQANEC